jgi:hypothetical protein
VAEEQKLDIFKLVKFGSNKKYVKNSTIFTEGTFGREMYILLKGSVEVTTGGVLLTTLKPGSFFGEMSLLTDLPRSASCRVPEDTYLLVINQDNFTKIIKEEPMLAYKLMQVMAERIRKLNIDIKLATKQLAKSSKSFAQTDNKNFNDVLENNFYEGILQKSMMVKSSYGFDEISGFFDGDIDIGTKDSYGRNLLSVAIAMNNEKMFDECMTKSIGANMADSAGNTPIMLATIVGNANFVKKLIDRDVNINARNLNDETALMMACTLGNAEITKLLLSDGADYFRRDATGNTALSFAVIFGQESCVKLLIDQKCDINIADKFGNTALHHAIKCSKESIARLLVQNGAARNAKDKHGKTPVALAEAKGMSSIISELKKGT